jgi:hypothetical protein
MQTWLKSGSNCRVDRWWPGKVFRMPRALLKKANKTWDFSLARRLHCERPTDQKGSVANG